MSGLRQSPFTSIIRYLISPPYSGVIRVFASDSSEHEFHLLRPEASAVEIVASTNLKTGVRVLDSHGRETEITGSRRFMRGGPDHRDLRLSMCFRIPPEQSGIICIQFDGVEHRILLNRHYDDVLEIVPPTGIQISVKADHGLEGKFDAQIYNVVKAPKPNIKARVRHRAHSKSRL